MNKTGERTIGEIVAADYRTAAVFQSFGIDFCCRGGKTIEEACADKGILKENVLAALEKVALTKAHTDDSYSDWPSDLLADHIEKRHHRYIEEKTPVLRQYLDKVASVHGKQHPELLEIRELFYRASGELAAHMKKEELILFPFIRKMTAAQKAGTTLPRPPFGTVQNPVRMMEQEHSMEGEHFMAIAELSGNYNPPAGACNTYRVTYSLLREFEEDLHLHIHLENNILFPRAVRMEKEMSR